MKPIRSASFMFAVAAGAVANAQVPTGIEGGVYFPSYGKVRSAFGSSLVRVGPSSMQLPLFGEALGSPNVSLITGSRDGNHLFLVPVTWNTTKALNENRDTVPYIQYGIGAYYADYEVDQDRKTVLGGTANVELGIVFNNTLKIAGRYDVYTERNGYRWDGMTLYAAATLFRF